MKVAQDEFAKAVENASFSTPSCPVYQNVSASPVIDAAIIKENIIAQICAPVRWTQTMQQMVADGVDKFVEVGGNGKVLTGFIKKLDRSLLVENL